ncbi:MAG: two-component sensor histidine kinase, partial [Gemmatimonadota bacterium]|nr:two-component sensor histidine kinase [Gemmatimonadota bacterium]
MRVRILAVVVLLLLVSSLASVLLLRAALFGQLDEDVAESLDREAEEFRLLSQGNNPRTGEPFGGDLEAIFDV